MADPRYRAARTFHLGVAGTNADGSNKVKEFAEGDAVPARDLEGHNVLGLAANGYLEAANEAAIAELDELKQAEG